MRARRGIAIALGGTAIAGLPATAAAQTTVTRPTKITVTAKDFDFKLSRTTVKAGTPIVLTLVNRGASPHDWAITGLRKTRILAPGQKQTIRFTIKKKGRYRYICTVPRHAQFGMVGQITVR